jgi:hypothetical protein
MTKIYLYKAMYYHCQSANADVLESLLDKCIENGRNKEEEKGKKENLLWSSERSAWVNLITSVSVTLAYNEHRRETRENDEEGAQHEKVVEEEKDEEEEPNVTEREKKIC